MADKVQFELVSPERMLASEAVDMVVVPAIDGDMGVLPGHAPVMTLLRPGIITTYEGSAEATKIFVGGGFAEANEKGVIVLAETAEPLNEISADRARQALKDAEEDLKIASSPSEHERAKLEQAVAVAQARLDVIGA